MSAEALKYMTFFCQSDCEDFFLHATVKSQLVEKVNVEIELIIIYIICFIVFIGYYEGIERIHFV